MPLKKINRLYSSLKKAKNPQKKNSSIKKWKKMNKLIMEPM
jgi:hypothetical protein